VSPANAWIDGVPSTWRVARLKTVGAYLVSNVDKLSSEDELPVRLCNYTDVYKNDYITGDMDFMRATATAREIRKFGLREGDVVITKDSETWDDIGIPAYIQRSAPDLVCGYHLAILRARSGTLSGRFLFRCLQSKRIRIQLELAANGVTRFGIANEEIGRLLVPIPPEKAQDRIANLLDRETARVNGLIERKEEMLRLLDEKRTSLVSRTVTRGLHCRARLRETGIPWLGKIPAHWGVAPLKRCIRFGTSVSYGIVQPGESQVNGVPFLQTTDITKATLDVAQLQRTTVEIANAYPRSRLEPGDVVLGIRASIGSVHVVGPEFEGVNLSRGIARICPDLRKVLSEFLALFLSSNAIMNALNLASQGSTFREVSIANLRELTVAVPPLPEQGKIIEAVQVSTGAIDRLVAGVGRSIALLREYRTALISAAVTGKLDVK
jgi:type I restriction enzyme, S subunit